MAKQSKRYRTLAEKTPAEEALPLAKAVEILKSFGTTKFDQTVEIHMHLGIDSKQADQLVRGSVVLPHGIGKAQRVIVFAKGDLANLAKRLARMRWGKRIWPNASKAVGSILTFALPLRT